MSDCERCKSCKYYIQYYTLTNLHFRRSCGACVCEKRSHRTSKTMENCDFWEKKETPPEQTKKSVEDTIYDINEKLYEILEVLNLDKN